MTKVRFFSNEHRYELEHAVNDFIRNKNVVNVSYSTSQVGYSIYHYCCVLYSE